MIMEKNHSGTVVGKTVRIKGTVHCDEELIVQGSIEGTIELSQSLFVEPGGEIHADIVVPRVQLAGLLVGSIVATERVEILSGAFMNGDIRSAPRVELMEGARFRGRIDMGDVFSDKS